MYLLQEFRVKVTKIYYVMTPMMRKKFALQAEQEFS